MANYQFDNIPPELKVLKQWIVWRYEDLNTDKPTKVPYDAAYSYTTKHADVTNPNTWSNFDATTKRFESDKYDGIGFVFTKQDPFCFIDLDSINDKKALTEEQKKDITEKQYKIFQEFNSYAEFSPSGSGLHIICLGDVPSGRKRHAIEIYSNKRYATFTGNIYNNSTIRDCKDEVINLWTELGDSNNVGNLETAHINENEKHSDDEIINQCEKAADGDKFKSLYKAEWKRTYPSQSEADLALINIIAYYTKNRAQIRRIFLLSELGKRAKAFRQDYFDRMLNKAFDQILPEIDLDSFYNKVEESINGVGHNGVNVGSTIDVNVSVNCNIGNSKISRPVAQLVEPVAHNGLVEGSSPSGPTISHSVILPPGLLGEIAQFIYAAAPLPVPEIALAGALGLMSGIAGRSYNVNGEGLNQYILLVARSGTGKEAMASGIDKLMNAIKFTVPTSINFMGPAEISSGEGLLKHLNKTQCFVSILGEFGYRLQALMDAKNTSLRRMLLDIYHKSGKGRVLQGKAYSDIEKNINETASPSFTILGETTPSTFYSCITEEMIVDGLLPRFSIIEYLGERVELNENCSKIYPSTELINKFASFVANCEVLNYNKKVIDIKLDEAAEIELKKFGSDVRNIINKSGDKEEIRQLWNRAHIKAWKLAGLVAVGVNPYDPIINLDNVKMAINMVSKDILILSRKLETGEVGASTDEVKQNSEIKRVIKEFIIEPDTKIAKYGNELLRFKNQHVIPYQYISRRLGAVSVFRKDKMGATFSIKRAIQNLLDNDTIREIGKQQLTSKLDTRQRCFIVSDFSYLG